MRPDPRQLLAEALSQSRFAYAPYSKFRVGAAVLTARGAVYTGCNVENASYGLTICAERSAVFRAVASEHSPKIVAVAVSGPRRATYAPCGACRQVIWEFGRDATIYFRDGARFRSERSARLLPSPFGLSVPKSR